MLNLWSLNTLFPKDIDHIFMPFIPVVSAMLATQDLPAIRAVIVWRSCRHVCHSKNATNGGYVER